MDPLRKTGLSKGLIQNCTYLGEREARMYNGDLEGRALGGGQGPPEAERFVFATKGSRKFAF